MKKFISALLTLAILLAPMSACFAEDAEPIRVITTIFPMYDWVRQVVGERSDSFDVKMLLTTGVDLHNYQPSVEDIVSVSDCDMFIYVGGASDAWVPDVLATAQNDRMVEINLLDVLGGSVKTEELVEGMEEEEHEHEGEEEEEADEHVWLSLRNAEIAVNEIAARLGEIDPDHAQEYAANAAAYAEKLSELDGRYQAAVDAAAKKTMLFGDRFPFRYLADDYGLEYYAAFSGCSAESEASFETIVFLASKVKELGLNAVLTLEGSDHSIADTVASTSGVKDVQIVEMNSMQSVTQEDIDAGADYLSIMEENLDALTRALG